MTAGPATGFASPVSLTVKKGASTASITFKRYGDRTLEFTNKNGVLKRYYSNAHGMNELWEAINALV